MSRRPPSTYLTADELKQIAATKFHEGALTVPGLQQQETLNPPQGPADDPKRKSIVPSGD
jgi:hypothetical protein